MLTVKLVEANDHLHFAHEQIHEVHEVWSSEEDGKRYVNARKSDGSVLTFGHGTLYVMNDHGRTVADYHFADYVSPA